MAYLTSGVIGASLTTVTTGTTTDGENALFALGTSCLGDGGSVWTYVQAGSAIAQYDCVSIDENFQAVPATSTTALTGHSVGFAQVAIADNGLAWVCTHANGNISVTTAANCAPDVQLYTVASPAGTLDDTSTGTLVRGVVGIAAATASIQTKEIIAAHPSFAATP